MNTSIDIRKSHINIIGQLLKFEGLTNQKEVLYKKTAKQFKKERGIDLKNAPIIFVKHNHIYRLSHTTYKHRGRTYESATYHPIVSVKDKFKRLERLDIKTYWDNKI